MICKAADLTVGSGSSIAICRISEVKRPCPSRVHNARRRMGAGVDSLFPTNRWWSETHCSRILVDFEGSVSTSNRCAISFQKPLALVNLGVISHRLGMPASRGCARDAFDAGATRRIRPVDRAPAEGQGRPAAPLGLVASWGFIGDLNPMSAMYSAPSGPF